jgi:hypothetical protein
MLLLPAILPIILRDIIATFRRHYDAQPPRWMRVRYYYFSLMPIARRALIF